MSNGGNGGDGGQGTNRRGCVKPRFSSREFPKAELEGIITIKKSKK